MSRRKAARQDIPISFRLPVEVQTRLVQKAAREDLNFSQIVRRALRREVEDAGIKIPKGDQ